MHHHNAWSPHLAGCIQLQRKFIVSSSNICQNLNIKTFIIFFSLEWFHTVNSDNRYIEH